MNRSTSRARAALAAGALATIVPLASCGDDGPPAEAADHVAAYPGESLSYARDVVEDVEWPEGQGRLRTPHSVLTLSQLRVAAAYAPDDMSEDEYGAADGHELLVATFDPVDSGTEPAGDTLAQMSWAVAVGDRVESLDPVRPGDTLVVSVPEGEEAFLQVTDEERTQGISLRTGLRGDDAVAGLNEAQPSQQLDHEYTGSGVAMIDDWGPAGADVEVTLDEAWRTAWYPGAGWAAPGRAWLVVDVGAVLVSASDQSDTMAANLLVGRTVDEGAYTLATPDGATATPATPDAAGGTTTEATRYAFDVPEATTSATLTIAPGGTGSWVTPPPPGTVDVALAPE